MEKVCRWIPFVFLEICLSDEKCVAKAFSDRFGVKQSEVGEGGIAKNKGRAEVTPPTLGLLDLLALDSKAINRLRGLARRPLLQVQPLPLPLGCYPCR